MQLKMRSKIVQCFRSESGGVICLSSNSDIIVLISFLSFQSEFDSKSWDCCCCCLVPKSQQTLLQPHELQPPRLLYEISQARVLKWVVISRASQVVLLVKNLPSNEGGVRDRSLISGSGRSPGGGHDNPLQYSCLKNPRDKGAWRTMALRVAESDMTEAI